MLGEARRHWSRALALRPDYAEPHSNLANLFSDLGEYGRAAGHARRAIGLRPRFADAYLNLAMVETARGDLPAALAVLEDLLAFAPGHATAMSAKAVTLREMDRLEEGLDWARRAVAAEPGNAEAAHALGQLCQALGLEEEARDAYARASRLPGAAAEKAASSQALLLMELGEADAAAAAFDAALRTYPRSAAIYYNRADLTRVGDDDQNIEAMLAMLESGDIESARDRMLLRFALGGVYLRSGDGARAFDHLNQANRMKRATLKYDGGATRRMMEAIAARYDEEAMGRLAGGGAGGGFTPVFVLGMPRSGTTLTEQILASHPAVFGAGELIFASRAIDRLNGDDFATAGAEYMAAVERRLGAAITGGRRYVVDKMPGNFLHAGPIHLMLPGARIIHCRRDPVDTCLSCYSKLFTREQHFSYDMTELGEFHLGYQALMAHWRAVLPASHFLEVAYEDVVDDLEGQARRMLHFLGLDWDPACLSFHETRRAVRTASVNQVRQKLYRGSAGRWKRHAEHLGPLLLALRMDPSG
jgi:tetratricopeptide (TPR) repeat protein